VKPEGQHRHVAIVQQDLPNYRTPFFECLRADLAKRGVVLDIIRSGPSRPGRLPDDIGDLPWARTVAAREFGIGSRRVLWQPLDRELRTADLVIVEQASRLLLNYVLLVRQTLQRRPMALWGHGRSFHPGSTATDLGELLKRWLSRRVYWWFAYNELSARVVNDLGFPAGRTTVVQNSTDTRRFHRLVEAVTPEALEQLRQRFGLHRGRTAIFVGNFHPDKQLPFLFEASEHLHRVDPDFSLVVVGSGIEQKLVEEMAAERAYVHYLGNRFDADLAEAFALADVVLVPGWAGLVIVDAFAAGLPIMPSASFPHPPEIGYVITGDNGILVEDGGSPQSYAERVLDLLEDPIEYQHLVRGCAAAAEIYSVEAMAARFADGVMQALSADTT
jgi:glycosyltransferase involved in cell wall biosynthesis